LGYGLTLMAPAVQFPVRPVSEELAALRQQEAEAVEKAQSAIEPGDTNATLFNMPAVRLPEDSAEFATDDTSKTLLNIPALILDDELVPAITSPETADDDELLQSVAKSDDVVMTEKSPVIVAETAQDPDRTLIAMPVITAEMLGEIPQVESDDIAKTQINLPALDIAIPAEPISLDEDKTLISMPSITDDQLLSAGTFQQESVTDFDSTLTFDAEALLGDMTFELRKPKPKADVVDIPAQTPVSEIGAMEATQDEVAPEETAEPDMMQATVRLEADTPASELIEHPDIDAAAGETVRVTVEAVVPDIEAVVESEAVAESQTAATIVAAARPVFADMPVDDHDQDDEIREIFIEEATEVLETIHEFFPKWAANFGNKSALTEFRRGFHTLKGSGRMVGAKVIGELAWSIENMLNRVIDNTATASGDMCALIEGVIAVVPEMIESFKNSEATTLNTSPVMSVAFEFAAGRPLSKAVIDAAFAMATGAVVSPAVEEAPVAAEAVQAAPETSKPETTTTAAGDEDLSDAFEALATSLEEVEPVEASALAFDPVLMEIFVSEANTYLDEIEQFLKETPATAKVPVTDEVLRALHTLRGSAGMAGVKTVSGLAAPMEGLFKDLRQQGRLINPVHMELLENVYRLIRQSISSVAEGGTGLVSGDTPLIARIEQVSRAPASEEEIALAVDAPANTAGIVAGFMELELDHLLDAPWELSGWLAGEDRAGHVATLLHELEVLTPAAISSGVQPLVSLLAALQAVYGFIASDIDASIANEALMEDIGNAHDELINIFDTLAACQTVVPNDALIASLRGWTGVEDAPVAEPVPAPVVMAPVPVTRAAVEIDNGADPELLSIFLEEGEEVLLAAEEEFRNWLADSDNKNALRALQRHLHTLKGGARMAVVASLGDLAHELEFLYEGLVDGRYHYSQTLADLCQRCHDRIANQLSDLQSKGSCEFARDLVDVINQYRRTPGDAVILDFSPQRQVVRLMFR